jgi:hypothetical protein
MDAGWTLGERPVVGKSVPDRTPVSPVSPVRVTYCDISRHIVLPPAMASERLSDIFASLSHDSKLEILSLSSLVQFIVYAIALRLDILLTHSARHNPNVVPEFLSLVIQSFLLKVINAGLETTHWCWRVSIT